MLLKKKNKNKQLRDEMFKKKKMSVSHCTLRVASIVYRQLNCIEDRKKIHIKRKNKHYICILYFILLIF